MIVLLVWSWAHEAVPVHRAAYLWRALQILPSKHSQPASLSVFIKFVCLAKDSQSQINIHILHYKSQTVYNLLLQSTIW